MNRVQILLFTALLGCAVATPAAFVREASAQAAEPAPSAGGKIFDKWCSDCHSTPQAPGSRPLQLKYRGQIPAVLEQRTDLAPAFVKLVVRRGMSFMPSFRKTEISDAELELLAAYLAPSQGRTRQATKQP